MITETPCDKGLVSAQPEESPCSRAAAPWVLAATIIASSMVFIDGTVVNVALPALQKDLRATVYDVQWIIESYALFLGALLLVGGAAGDRFGRSRVFLLGLALFTIASVLCGLAQNVTQLIAARAVQGIGGALLVPGSLAIISSSFGAKDRGRAIGTWSGFTAMTAALGPVLGGFLIDHYSWRAAFLMNVPLALAVAVIAYRHVPESRNEHDSAAIDWAGAVLATAGLGGLVFGLIESSRDGWGHPAVFASTGGGILALAGFIAVEKTSKAPMLPLKLFRSRTFSGTNLLTFLLYAALGGSLFFLPLNLIQVQGYSTVAAGAALLPFILMMFFLSTWAGTLVNRYGARLPLVIGPSIAALGFALLAVPGAGGSYWTTFFPAMLVLGFGMVISVAPLTATVMGSVEQDLVGVASGINNAVSRIAALLAVAVMGIVMTRAFNLGLDEHLRALPASAASQFIDARRDQLAAIELPKGLDAPTYALYKKALSESFIRGYRWVMGIAAVLALAGALSAFALVGDKGQRRAGR